MTSSSEKDGNADKVVVVTGGNSGIGRGIANYFGARGYRVAIVGRNAETLAETQKEVGANCLSFNADVAKRDDVFAAVKGVVNAWGRIDVLINNAGATSHILTSTPLEEAERNFRETINVHMTGAFLMVMAAAAHLTRPGGRIINISSIGSFVGGRRPGASAYVAAKAGLNGLTHSWARELSPQGITVNAIAPGFIDTALTKLWSAERRKASIDDILVGRPGEPEDIAATAYFLASPAASFISGEIINVNGGARFIH